MVKKPTELWIDALDFENKGGWKVDTQYVHLMGSGYLIAADVPGVPVADATMEIKVPESGHYRIWVRDRNWLRPHNPGRFTLLVDGEDAGNVLGQIPSDKWLWEIAGDVELTEGVHTISLHDLTGYFGRCASILITNDFDYVPSREIERTHAERARIKGLSTETVFGGQYDVIVAGGGPGGVPAAISAARLGAKVLLLQNRPMLGGNASDEIGVTMDGAEAFHVYAREGGIAEEIRRLRDRDPSFIGDYTRAMEALCAAEENLTVLCNHHVCGVEMKSATEIESVYTLNFQDLSRQKFDGKLFIDCTGDAWLGYYAGAKYRFGREAYWQHKESIADKHPDMLTMSGCLKAGNRLFFTEGDEPVEYHAPSWVPELPKDDLEFGRVINGSGAKMHWWIEAPNVCDDMWDGEETRDALILATLGYYDHIKNYWSRKERAKYVKLRFPSVTNGRREGRRLIGDYILTQDDCFNKTTFDDAISYSGWHLDVHHPEGIYSGAVGPMHCSHHVPMPQIPYRCLYSANIDNLFMAGRNISVTHLALGTTRLENTIATFGQAVGTAAHLCLKYGVNPRGIYENHIRELQQLLIKNDQYIPGYKNEDENDPCLTATAYASSVKKDEIFQNMMGNDDELAPLDVARAMTICVPPSEGDVEELWVKLHSANADPTTVTMHAYTMGTGIFSFAEFGETVTAQAQVPPMGEGWVKFPIHIPIPSGGHVDRCIVRVWLDAEEGISWRAVKDLSFNFQAGIMKENGKVKLEATKSYRHSVTKPIEELANCGPENAINGYSRIISAEEYEWVSDPRQALPQWLALEFAVPATINSVSVAFDSDLTNPGTCWHAESKADGVPACVKDYTVEVFNGSDWVKVADVEGNFQRKRVHSFDTMTAERIRVTVSSTWGDPSARIMEVRAALEK